MTRAEKPGELVARESNAVEHVGQVVDAELVNETPPVRRPVRDVAVVVVRPITVVVHKVRESERATRTSKALLRNAVYVVTGLGVLLRRLWEAKTNSRYERLMTAAEKAGDLDRVAEWELRGELARERRHRRRMDWVRAPFQLAKALAATVATAVGALLALGVVLAVTHDDPAEVLGPITTAFEVVAWVVAAVAVVWGLLLVAGPFLLVLGLWHIGRKAEAAPRWLQVDRDSSAVVINEEVIAHALAHLGISALTQAAKRGERLIYTSIPARDGGRGVHAAVRLPAGVTAAEVVDRKKKLAANFGRAAVETWPSVGGDEAVLDLWVADRGALDTGAGPWPLLETTEPIDCFTGVPVGVTLRGEAVVPPLDGTSWLIGGRPGQGKTSFTRLLVMGACLDPRAEVWVHVLADNADFDPLADRFARYEVGMGHDVAEAALAAFGDLLAEIERRGRVMRQQGVASAAEAGFPPLVAAFDEVHRLFQHREYGGDAAFVAEDLVKQARKYGIILILATQSPTSTSIPRPVTREVICRVAFSVIDQVGNDALLGDGSYRNGVRATELRPGSKHSPGDRGKALTVGVVPDSDWELIIGHHVDLDGVRQVAELAQRFGTDPGADISRSAPRDLLADVAEVLGTEPTPAADVPALLAKAFSRWEPYRRLTGKALRERLASEYGVKVASTGNRWPVDPRAVREALARRLDARR